MVYIRNKKKKKKYDSEYREKKKEQIREYMRNWRIRNLEEIKRKKRDYYHRTKTLVSKFGRPPKYSNEQLIEAIKNSDSFSHVTKYLNICYSGSNVKAIKLKIKELKLSISHFLTKKELLIRNGKNSAALRTIANKDLFVKNSRSCPGVVRRRILEQNLIKYVCEICGQLPIHNNKPLTLQLDHKNGICNDNRFDNLRWLCPNCHTQTPTYSRKNEGNVPKYLSELRKNRNANKKNKREELTSRNTT